jgi:hypothetical protein
LKNAKRLRYVFLPYNKKPEVGRDIDGREGLFDALALEVRDKELVPDFRALFHLSGMRLKRGQSCTDKVKIFRQRFLSAGFAAEIVSVRQLLSLKHIDGCSADCTGIRHSCFLFDSV